MKPASVPAVEAAGAAGLARRVDEAMDVVARLPLLGPLIGWTRAIGPGVMRSRIWACLDGSESELPLAMLTVGWNRAKGAIHPGSARLWRLNAVRLARDGPERRLHIGLADVFLPIGAIDQEVRVVALHRCIRRPSGDAAQSLPSDLLPEERGAEGWRPSLALGRELLTLMEPGGRMREPFPHASSRTVAAGEDWPQPQSIDVAALLPEPRTRHAVRAWLHEFAREALQAVDQAQDAAAAFERRRGPRYASRPAAAAIPAPRSNAAGRTRRSKPLRRGRMTRTGRPSPSSPATRSTQTPLPASSRRRVAVSAWRRATSRLSRHRHSPNSRAGFRST